MTESNQTDQAAAKTLQKRKKGMIILSLIFLIIGLVWFLYWFIWGRFELYTDNAYVNGNIVQVMPQISGTIVDIKAEETQLVTQGQVLVRLDPTDYAIALQRAKADLAQTVRQVRQYFENATQSKQNMLLNNANLVKAQLDLKRRMALVGTLAVSKEEVQHFKTSLEAAEASYQVAISQSKTAFALVANTHLYTHPLVETAKTNLKMAYLNLLRTTIVAPVTGYIAKRRVQPGQQVSMSSVLLAIIPLNDTWLDANYKESSLDYIRVDQPVTIYADAYPDIRYHGKVVGLNAGTGSAFALLPPQNATGNWIKILQRLPVRISLDPNELKANPLQLGLSLRVTIDIHNTDGKRMQHIPDKSFVFSTQVFEKQAVEMDKVIKQILNDNSADMFLPKDAS
jgi:membrane fusion protein (multidrug efflux system)